MPATATFPGLTLNDGFRMTHVRGVHPSACLIYSIPQANFGRAVDDLILDNGLAGTERETIVFRQCCATGWRFTQGEGRDAERWTVPVFDRRWMWRYHRISGHYNVRKCDGQIDPATQKTAAELVDLILKTTMGESDAVITGVSPAVFPEVHWENDRADLELEWLLEKLGCTIWLGTDNIVYVGPLGAGAIPTLERYRDTNFQFLPALMPSAVKWVGEPSVYQLILELEAVGLDIDGAIKLIDDLSYKPAAGWGEEWPWDFPNVDPQYRHLAVRSVHRWFRWKPVTPTGSPIAVTKASQIHPLGHLAEAIADIDGELRCPPAMLKGTFWPMGETNANQIDHWSSVPFKILDDYLVVETEAPLVRLDDGICKPAVLELYSAVNITDATTGEYVRHEFSEPIPTSITPTEPRVIRSTGLFHVVNDNPVFVGNIDNQSAVEAEAAAYTGGVMPQYTFTQTDDRQGENIQDVNLSGATAQIRWEAGGGVLPYTRIGVNHEFDVFTFSHQQRRRNSRLAQLAERTGVV